MVLTTSEGKCDLGSALRITAGNHYLLCWLIQLMEQVQVVVAMSSSNSVNVVIK